MFFALKVTAGNDDAKEAKSRVQVSVGYPEELDFVLCNRPSLAIIRDGHHWFIPHHVRLLPLVVINF